MNSPEDTRIAALEPPADSGDGQSLWEERGLRRRVPALLAACLVFLAPFLLLAFARAEGRPAWQPLGLRGETVLGLAVASSGGEQLLYAEAPTGLWRYRSEPAAGSEAWEQIDVGLPRTPLGGPALAAWRAVPGRPQQLYALTGVDTARQLYRSDDGGQTWTNVGPAPGQTARPAMLVLPGLGGAPDWIALTTSSRVQRSTDAGATWSPGGPWPASSAAGRDARGAEPVQVLLAEASAPERLFAISREGALWLSESSGLSWRAAALDPDMRVTALDVAPYFGVRVWAGMNGGLAYSPDSGDSWSLLPSPKAPGGAPGDHHGRIVALCSDPRVPETVYVALLGGAVYRSDDRGSTWSALGAPSSTRVTALALDPDSRSLLYAATDDGVWVRRVAPFEPTPMPTASDTPIPTATPTATETPQPTATPTPQPTATETPTATATPTITATASPTATSTRRPTPSRTPAPTPTWTASPEPTPTPAEPSPAPASPEPRPSATPTERPATPLPGTPPHR